VAQETLEITVGYDEAGVRWLDGYIDRQRENGDPQVKERLLNTLGSYLGECVRQTFGGDWVQDPNYGWAVKVNEKLSVFPFAKVRKQLNSADGESVLAFFRAIPALMHGRPKRS
jgi:hypothetical protein